LRAKRRDGERQRVRARMIGDAAPHFHDVGDLGDRLVLGAAPD
jgi:hypothetical protein